MSTITRVEAVLVRVPLKRNYRGSSYSVPEKNAIITRIHTDDGLVGIGNAIVNVLLNEKLWSDPDFQRYLFGATSTLPKSSPAINATRALNTATPVSRPNA